MVPVALFFSLLRHNASFSAVGLTKTSSTVCSSIVTPQYFTFQLHTDYAKVSAAPKVVLLSFHGGKDRLVLAECKSFVGAHICSGDTLG